MFLDFELLGPNWNYFKFCQIFYKLIQTNFKPKTNPFPSLGPNPAGPTWAGRGHSNQTSPRAPHLGTELNIVTALSRPRAVRPAAADPWTPPNVFTSCRHPLLSLSCGPTTKSYPSPSSSQAVVPASPNTHALCLRTAPCHIVVLVDKDCQHPIPSTITRCPAT